jgi:hypothetical protein
MASQAQQYLAADERAREARRAGLQAKKEEQPQNTARSYAAKQREWRASILYSSFSLGFSSFFSPLPSRFRHLFFSSSPIPYFLFIFY